MKEQRASEEAHGILGEFTLEPRRNKECIRHNTISHGMNTLAQR